MVSLSLTIQLPHDNLSGYFYVFGERTTMASEENKKQPQGNGKASVEKKVESKKPESSLRKSIKNPFVYIGTIVILILTIIAFVLIPSVGGGVSSAGQTPSFGSWNGVPIQYTSDSYFADQVSQINDYLRQQGVDQSQSQLYAYQVWRMAFQNTAVRTAIMDIAKRSGMKISEQTIDEEVAKNSQFQVDGKFSLEKYNSTLLSTRMSIRNKIRDDQLIQNYYGDIMTVSPTTGEIEFVASMAKPQRTIQYVDIPYSSFPEDKTTEWAKNNESLFRTIGLSKISINTSQKDAEKVLAQIKANSLSFEDAAKSHSKDAYADKGGDMGTKTFYDLKGEFLNDKDAEAVMALKKDEISSVYKEANNTWAFYRVNTETSMPDFSKQSVLDEVKSYLFDKEKSVMESWALSKANEFTTEVSKSSFAVAAKKVGMEAKSAGPFILNYGKPSFYFYGQQVGLFQEPYRSLDTDLVDAEENETFLTTLFSTAKDTVSKPVVLGASVVVITVTNDAESTEQESSYTKFSYPYFYQTALENQARSTILSSKLFKDEFNTTFAKLFTSTQKQ